MKVEWYKIGPAPTLVQEGDIWVDSNENPNSPRTKFDKIAKRGMNVVFAEASMIGMFTCALTKYRGQWWRPRIVRGEPVMVNSFRRKDPR